VSRGDAHGEIKYLNNIIEAHHGKPRVMATAGVAFPSPEVASELAALTLGMAR
jgi:transposase-like protein